MSPSDLPVGQIQTLPNETLQGVVSPTSPPPPPGKRDSFVMSFIRPKKDLFKFLPLVLVLFLVISLPLAVVLVKQRQLGESQGQVTPTGCVCESVTADRDLGNLNIGDVVVFSGMGKTDEPDDDIVTIKFIVKKNGEEVIVEEKNATFDHEEGNLKFYRSEEFSYVIQEYGDYEVTIEVECPQT